MKHFLSVVVVAKFKASLVKGVERIDFRAKLFLVQALMRRDVVMRAQRGGGDSLARRRANVEHTCRKLTECFNETFI